MGLVMLAAYHSRSGMAEMDEGKKLFERALAKTERRDLVVQMVYATKYACAKGDPALYQRSSPRCSRRTIPDPEQRLENTIAKREAKRWLGRRRVKDQCGFDLPARVRAGARCPRGGEPRTARAPEETPAPAPAAPVKPAKPGKASRTSTPKAKPAAAAHD